MQGEQSRQIIDRAERRTGALYPRPPGGWCWLSPHALLLLLLIIRAKVVWQGGTQRNQHSGFPSRRQLGANRRGQTFWAPRPIISIGHLLLSGGLRALWAGSTAISNLKQGTRNVHTSNVQAGSNTFAQPSSRTYSETDTCCKKHRGVSPTLQTLEQRAGQSASAILTRSLPSTKTVSRLAPCRAPITVSREPSSKHRLPVWGARVWCQLPPSIMEAFRHPNNSNPSAWILTCRSVMLSCHGRGSITAGCSGA